MDPNAKPDDVLDLDAVEELTYRVKINGKVEAFDALDLFHRLRDVPTSTADADFAAGMDRVRAAFRLPMADAAGPAALPAYKCLRLLNDFARFMKAKEGALGELKGPAAPTPSSSGSTDSAPAN